jgi:hypothetical protein
MQIICNLFHYAEEGREPAPLSETHYEIVQDLYLEQIKRSKRTSEARRASAFARYRDPNSPLPYMDITDPEELRRALESDPVYRNDDIDELVNLRMLMLDKSKKKGEETE